MGSDGISGVDRCGSTRGTPGLDGYPGVVGSPGREPEETPVSVVSEIRARTYLETAHFLSEHYWDSEQVRQDMACNHSLR